MKIDGTAGGSEGNRNEIGANEVEHHQMFVINGWLTTFVASRPLSAIDFMTAIVCPNNFTATPLPFSSPTIGETFRCKHDSMSTSNCSG
jgi:hypothetical protein